jgi:hypothetical protein
MELVRTMSVVCFLLLPFSLSSSLSACWWLCYCLWPFCWVDAAMRKRKWGQIEEEEGKANCHLLKKTNGHDARRDCVLPSACLFSVFSFFLSSILVVVCSACGVLFVGANVLKERKGK